MTRSDPHEGLTPRIAALISLLFTLISGPTIAFVWGFMAVMFRWANVDEDQVAWNSALAGMTIGMLASIVYHAGMESSRLQATVGKLLLSVKVTDLQGRRISFLRALGRFAGKFVSGSILCIGFIMAAFTAKRQALHDLIAGTLVMKVR